MVKKNLLAAFTERFWEARRLQMGKHTAECLKAYTELAAWARANGIPNAALNAEAAALEAQGEYNEALSRLTKALDTGEAQPSGLALFILGSVLYEQKEYDEAIASYARALDEPSFDKPGIAWNNMGLAYGKKGDYDKAIECFRKALDEKSYDTPGKAWNNMGVVHSNKGEHDKAIECYRKALDDTSYDTPGYAWNNMGVAYKEKGDYDKAIECFRKALDDTSYDTPSYALAGMGLAYLRKAEHDKARECFHKAEKALVAAGDIERAAAVRAVLAALGVRESDRSERDQALLRETRATPAGEKVAPSALGRLRDRLVATEQTAYEEYAQRPGPPEENILAVLKGWGSAVPLIEGGERACRGGGYFLSWGGKGIVIDPGFDFLSNFHAEGFHLRQVHGVIVSHNHPDHTHDLESMDSVFYEMAKQKDPKRDTFQYVVICDADTHGAHPNLFEKKAHRTPAPHFDRSRLETGQENELQLPREARLPFKIGYFAAHHGSTVPNAVGIRITCLDEKTKDLVIGFSCDTEFYDELCDNQHLGGCDLLVLHVSHPTLEELEDANCIKEEHLGFRGVERLVKKCQPRLTIVCEFWAGIADLRIELLQALREECGTKAILPGGVGMLVNLRTLEVRCTKCEKWTPQSEILVSGPQEPFGPPMYLCPHCRL